MQQLLKIIFISCLSFIQIQAQLTTDKLDYSQYEPGEQRYNFLEIQTGLQVTLEQQNHRSDFSGLVLSQKRIRNTEKRQVEFGIETGLSYSENLGLGLAMSLDYKSRNYISKRFPKLFIPVDAAIQVQGISSYSVPIGTRLSSGLGYGRISILNEVEIAERIIEKIISTKSIEPDSKNQDVIQLADYFTELKNQRYFTNRGEWESELALVQAKLMELGYRVDNDALENEVKKIYGREPLILREEGTLFTLRGTTSDYRNSSPWVDLRGGNKGLAFQIEDNNFLSAKVQWNNEFSLGYNNVNTSYHGQDFLKIGENYSLAQVGMKSSLHFLPDVDSRFSVSLGTHYQKAFNYSYNGTDIFRTSDDISGLGVDLGFEYEKRISRNTRITLGLDFGYSKYTKGDFSVAPSLKLKF